MGARFGLMTCIGYLERTPGNLSKKLMKHRLYAILFAGDQEYKDEKDE